MTISSAGNDVIPLLGIGKGQRVCDIKLQSKLSETEIEACLEEFVLKRLVIRYQAGGQTFYMKKDVHSEKEVLYFCV